jgi:hypothetical protein
LFDLRFAAGTAAPVTSLRYLHLYYDALVRISTLQKIGVGWVLSDVTLPPPFVRVAGAQRVNVYRVDGALPMAYVIARGGATIPVRTLALDASSATMRVVTPQPGLLVLTQNDARGWQVRVDGRNSQKRLCFGTFRGVDVAAGTHEVEWRYRPFSIGVGAVVTFIALLSCVLLSSISRMKIFFASH